MRNNRLAKIILLGATVVLLQVRGADAACPPPPNPQNCATMAFCATSREEVAAFRNVDQAFVKTLKTVSRLILKAIDDMDNRVAESIIRSSKIREMAYQSLMTDITKTENGRLAIAQNMEQEQQTLEQMQTSIPSDYLKEDAEFKATWPQTEVMTRAIGQALFKEYNERQELWNSAYVTNKDDPISLKYSQGQITGMARMFAIHNQFFCNAEGVNTPADCGKNALSTAVNMGDQMMEIYLGESTWPEEQVLRSMELMQFYLGILPPDLPKNTDFSSDVGQRDFMEYQSRLARNNLMTYMLSHLASKRAPTNESNIRIVKARKDAAGCSTLTNDNTKLCSFLDELMKGSVKSSKAELTRMMEFTRYMNPAFSPMAITGTMGIDKDIAIMMADRLRQDYEEYQMDKMIVGAMAGMYADVVNKAK